MTNRYNELSPANQQLIDTLVNKIASCQNTEYTIELDATVRRPARQGDHPFGDTHPVIIDTFSVVA